MGKCRCGTQKKTKKQFAVEEKDSENVGNTDAAFREEKKKKSKHLFGLFVFNHELFAAAWPRGKAEVRLPLLCAFRTPPAVCDPFDISVLRNPKHSQPAGRVHGKMCLKVLSSANPGGRPTSGARWHQQCALQHHFISAGPWHGGCEQGSPKYVIPAVNSFPGDTVNPS